MAETRHDFELPQKGNDSEEDMFDLSQSSQKSIHFVTDEEASNELVDYKVFNDSIHGHILMHPLLVKIIDTPQFQRLRNVKQLGSTYFVYPGASHNRFEHCIGTSHLAGKLVRMLQKNQKNLKITDEDILCVEMAGLCHDLGHGPYSHMFDGRFLPRTRPGCDWTHEKGSCMMIDHLIDENKLELEFLKYNITDKDVTFVKEMIAGLKEDGPNDNSWLYKGRGEEKSFLYEIVSNERNKVDVDKWDYFARDCYHLGIRNSFDHNRFMQFTKVLKVEGERLQICARDKESYNLYEMFHIRSVLHRMAYQHRVATAIDLMICDAMTIAEPYIKFVGKGGNLCTISQCVDDPVAYTQLSDNIFDRIAQSTEFELKPARNLLQRILTRRLYQYIGATRPNRKTGNVLEEIVAFTESGTLEAKDLVYNTARYNYGMKDKNPIDSFKFFSKSDPKKPYRIRRQDVSPMLPGIFEESEIQVFCVSENQTKVQIAKDCFKMWCESMGITQTDFSQGGNDLITPMKQKRHQSQHQTNGRKTKQLKFS